MESSMRTLQERLDELVRMTDAIALQDDLTLIRSALYTLRERAWNIIADIDIQRLAEWRHEQEAISYLSLEDIGL
jgi:hypothetical protein